MTPYLVLPIFFHHLRYFWCSVPHVLQSDWRGLVSIISCEIGPLKSRGVSLDLGVTVSCDWQPFRACFRLVVKGRTCFSQDHLLIVHV